MVGGFVRNSLNSLNIVRPALIEHHHQLCAVYINRTAPTHLVLCSRPQRDTVTRPRSLQKRVVRFHCIAMRLEVLASCESRERRIRQISKSGYSSSLVLPWTLYCKTCREFGTSLPSRSNESSNHEYDCSYVPRGPTFLISIQTVNGFRVRAEDVECKRGSDRYFLFASYLQRDARLTVVCVCGIIR